MKCKDCISFKPSELNKEWGICNFNASQTVIADKECYLNSQEKQSQYKIINGGEQMDEYIRDYSKISTEDVLNKIDEKILKMVESKVNLGEIEKDIKDIIILQKAKNIIEDCLDEIYEEEWEGEK